MVRKCKIHFFFFWGGGQKDKKMGINEKKRVVNGNLI